MTFNKLLYSSQIAHSLMLLWGLNTSVEFFFFVSCVQLEVVMHFVLLMERNVMVYLTGLSSAAGKKKEKPEADWGERQSRQSDVWRLSISSLPRVQLMWKSFSNYDVDWRSAAVPSPGSCPSPHQSLLTALWWIRNCHPGRLSLVYKSAIPHLSPQAL